MLKHFQMQLLYNNILMQILDLFLQVHHLSQPFPLYNNMNEEIHFMHSHEIIYMLLSIIFLYLSFTLMTSYSLQLYTFLLQLNVMQVYFLNLLTLTINVMNYQIFPCHPFNLHPILLDMQNNNQY
jgi:hypothetical protein